MSIINLTFGIEKRVNALSIRTSELEARLVRAEKALARQRRVNEALLAILEENTGWAGFQRSIDEALAIE